MKEDIIGKGKKKKMRADRSRAELQYFDKREYCILCGKLADVAKDQPLSKREFYIEGAGQLCRECYQEIYVPRYNADIVRLND